MNSSIENSKRIKAFRRELIEEVPRFPNNKASLQAMKSKTLTDLLITYIGWRLRYVAARPRKVEGLSALLASDPRAAGLKPNIDAFVKAVQAGNDLTPYLSLLPHTRGYTPAAESRTPGADRWADKDFLLNVMGLHHFHLGLTFEATGHIKRTCEVLFASVKRDTFEILGLFDHSAFEHPNDGAMTPERVKLWTLYQKREAAGALPGQFWVGGYANRGITLSAQPVAVTRAAQRHVKKIREIEPKLDDRAYVRTLYGEGAAPAKPKLRWHYRHLDFGLEDRPTSFFGVIEQGPN
jgi:hypothetical protein